MKWQHKVKELKDRTMMDHLEMNQMAEKMVRVRQLHHDEQRSLEGRLSQEILIRQGLMVALNDGQDGIEQMIQHYTNEMRKQGHQFDLVFAAVLEEKRVHNQQYKDIQEVLHV